MAAIRPQTARRVLPWVDPARLYSGRPVGLRDGALLALLAAGFSAAEICALKASSITMVRGRLLITVRRHGVLWRAVMPADLGSRLLAWLTESRLWAASASLFAGPQGPLTRTAIHQILHRYLRQSGRGKSLTSSQTIEKNYERDPHAAAVAERS